MAISIKKPLSLNAQSAPLPEMWQDSDESSQVGVEALTTSSQYDVVIWSEARRPEGEISSQFAVLEHRRSVTKSASRPVQINVTDDAERTDFQANADDEFAVAIWSERRRPEAEIASEFAEATQISALVKEQLPDSTEQSTSDNAGDESFEVMAWPMTWMPEDQIVALPEPLMISATEPSYLKPEFREPPVIEAPEFDQTTEPKPEVDESTVGSGEEHAAGHSAAPIVSIDVDVISVIETVEEPETNEAEAPADPSSVLEPVKLADVTEDHPAQPSPEKKRNSRRKPVTKSKRSAQPARRRGTAKTRKPERTVAAETVPTPAKPAKQSEIVTAESSATPPIEAVSTASTRKPSPVGQVSPTKPATPRKPAKKRTSKSRAVNSTRKKPVETRRGPVPVTTEATAKPAKPSARKVSKPVEGHVQPLKQQRRKTALPGKTQTPEPVPLKPAEADLTDANDAAGLADLYGVHIDNSSDADRGKLLFFNSVAKAQEGDWKGSDEQLKAALDSIGDTPQSRIWRQAIEHSLKINKKIDRPAA